MALSHRNVQLLESIAKGSNNLVTVAIITNANSSPYTVVPENITGFTCLNTSGSNTLTFTFTFSDASTMVIPVLSGGSYIGAFEKTITTIAYAGTSPSFTSELMRKAQ